MPKVTIVPLAAGPDSPAPIEVEVTPGGTLFEAGAKVSAGIDTACVGKGTCGLCRVKILAGADQLNPFTDEERKHLGNVYHITKVRLACRCKPSGDVTIAVVRKKT
jgi:ferredoxin